MRTSRLAALVVLALVPLIAPYVARGQTPGNVPRIGIIHLTGHHQLVVDGLRQGLRELGLEEGRHIVLDIRQIPDDLKLVEEVARDLERGRVALIYTVTTPVTVAAKRVTTFHEQGLVAKGALAAYGASYFDIGRVSAKHVQRILAGTHPKDLPLERYDKVGLAINLRTARELSLTMPPALLRRADTVIE